jgi:hypothetical protein
LQTEADLLTTTQLEPELFELPRAETCLKVVVSQTILVAGPPSQSLVAKCLQVGDLWENIHPCAQLWELRTVYQRHVKLDHVPSAANDKSSAFTGTTN